MVDTAMSKKFISGIMRYLWIIFPLMALCWLVYIYLNCDKWPEKNCTGFLGKTVWDVLELIIIPITITGVIAFLDKLNRKTDRDNADRRASVDHKIAQDNQFEVALQNFYDSMTNLLLDYDLRNSKPEDEVIKIAQAKTITILEVIDLDRKAKIISFLGEIGLFYNHEYNTPIISLAYMKLNKIDLHLASLQYVNLFGAFLEEAELRMSHLEYANLEHANLRRARLNGAEIIKASLNCAELSDAEMKHVNLFGAKLSSAKLDGANFERANLEEADISNALLKNANLEYANLKNANLFRASLVGANLNKANLEGAKMPDNKIYNPSIHNIEILTTDNYRSE